MSDLKEMKPTAIEWPAIEAGDARYTLRLAYSANYQLTRWGLAVGTATAVELAAAMAGTFDARGKWKSAGFERALDLADLLTPEQEAPLVIAVTEALKKAYPELEVISAQPVPGTTAPTTKSDFSDSGPSPLPEVASA